MLENLPAQEHNENDQQHIDHNFAVAPTTHAKGIQEEVRLIQRKFNQNEIEAANILIQLITQEDKKNNTGAWGKTDFPFKS